jgi:hypothetical protein
MIRRMNTALDSVQILLVSFALSGVIFGTFMMLQVMLDGICVAAKALRRLPLAQDDIREA